MIDIPGAAHDFSLQALQTDSYSSDCESCSDLNECFFESSVVVDGGSAAEQVVEALNEELDYLEAFVDGEEFVSEDDEMANREDHPSSATAKTQNSNPADSVLRNSSASSHSDVVHDCVHHHYYYSESSSADILSLEDSFCRDFICCGRVLNDMHELLCHYEECHVQLEDNHASDYENNAFPVSEEYIESCDEYQNELNQTEMYSSCLSSSLRRSTTTTRSSSEYICDLDELPISAFDDSVITASVPKRLMNDELAENNPLIRRVGDVEDDLGLTMLEWMHEEFERSGKRLKMFGDVMTYNCHERCSSDEEVDVVTVDSSGAVTANGKDNAGLSKKENISISPQFYDENGLRVDKPYRCSYPGCEKAYKNPNGLKYHNLHGHSGGDDEDSDYPARLMKPYVCNYTHCFKRYKNLNGLKYHIEKTHGFTKAEANQLATDIVKKTNAKYGINARSVPASVLFAAIKEHEEKEKTKNLKESFENSTPLPDAAACIAYSRPINSCNSDVNSGNVDSSSTKNHPMTQTPAIAKKNIVTRLDDQRVQIPSVTPVLSSTANLGNSGMKTIYFAPGQLIRSANGALIPMAIAPTQAGCSSAVSGGATTKTTSVSVSAPQTIVNGKQPSPILAYAGIPAYIQTLAASGFIDLKNYIAAYQNLQASGGKIGVNSNNYAASNSGGVNGGNSQ